MHGISGAPKSAFRAGFPPGRGRETADARAVFEVTHDWGIARHGSRSAAGTTPEGSRRRGRAAAFAPPSTPPQVRRVPGERPRCRRAFRERGGSSTGSSVAAGPARGSVPPIAASAPLPAVRGRKGRAAGGRADGRRSQEPPAATLRTVPPVPRTGPRPLRPPRSQRGSRTAPRRGVGTRPTGSVPARSRPRRRGAGPRPRRARGSIIPRALGNARIWSSRRKAPGPSPRAGSGPSPFPGSRATPERPTRNGMDRPS